MLSNRVGLHIMYVQILPVTKKIELDRRGDEMTRDSSNCQLSPSFPLPLMKGIAQLEGSVRRTRAHQEFGVNI